jgi:hypothetical protein
VMETGEVELPHPPLLPHLRNQILWGYPPPLFCRQMDSTLGSLPLLLRLEFVIVGMVCFPLCRILRQLDAPRYATGTPRPCARS